MALEYDISSTKEQYRNIFNQNVDFLFGKLSTLKASYQCAQCDAQGLEPILLEPMHLNCGYRPWQQESIACIEQEIALDILTRLNQINAYKNTFQCHQCGVCCRFASSEFSFDELLAKAGQGDYFAQQFTSVFLPYASQEKAQGLFPEIVESVLAQAEVKDPEKAPEKPSVYFYHCPYVGEDNRCSIYGSPKRPEICSKYPDTPLTFIYKNCAWKPWKDET
ncbi:MAG: YkgJ family cysteine cluster protein, partial [Cyanobacteria bacterium]|nr:YkgJ family cysteine cluster protein [Cyanobacteriota bacterium]